MIIHINEENGCLCCGSKDKKITSHHAIPKNLKPKNNVIIPICEDCHNKINIEDINGMYSYLYRIQKVTRESSNEVKRALGNLDSLTKLKLKKEKNKNGEI